MFLGWFRNVKIDELEGVFFWPLGCSIVDFVLCVLGLAYLVSVLLYGVGLCVCITRVLLVNAIGSKFLNDDFVRVGCLDRVDCS